MYDLLLKGGRVIDPASGFDGIADIAFKDGKVAARETDIDADGTADVRDVGGRIVTPGLIDLHTHVYWGGTSIGVDPDAVGRLGGTTTLIDAGTAGPANFAGFRSHIIEPADTRVLAYINVSFPGIFAFSAQVMIGECVDIRLLNAPECVRVAREHADLIVGVKVRVGQTASGSNGIMPLDIALEVAEELGLPVMAHLDYPPPSRLEVISRLRRGDILTHCFRPFPNAPVGPDGAPREEALAARERGVIFDIGHGKGSFAFQTAQGMLAGGFQPDCISSDVHTLSIDGPAYNILDSMSKFICLGMPLADVVRATTVNPANAVRHEELGRLSPGLPGDATVLDLRAGQFEYRDARDQVMTGAQKLFCAGMVLGGRWWHDGDAATQPDVAAQ